MPWSRSPSARVTKTRRWARLRRQILDEANWRCRKCGKYANEVDHILPISKGGSALDRENLQALCRGCHIEKTRKENRRKLSPEEESWRLLIDELMD